MIRLLDWLKWLDTEKYEVKRRKIEWIFAPRFEDAKLARTIVEVKIYRWYWQVRYYRWRWESLDEDLGIDLYSVSVREL